MPLILLYNFVLWYSEWHCCIKDYNFLDDNEFIHTPFVQFIKVFFLDENEESLNWQRVVWTMDYMNYLMIYK